MTKEKYMALADLQTVWTNSIKPWIVAGFIAVTPVAEGATAKLVLQDGSLLDQSTFQPAGNYVLASEKGANNGVATLGADGKVPSSQLPSYVDDVLEFANQAAFPATGEAGKIYVALDTNKTYRWGGTAYVVISETLALGETQGTAYEGSKGKANADAIAALQSNKADKVESATNGNFAGLDSNGNLTDSGKKASDFVEAETGKRLMTTEEGTKLAGIEAGAQVNIIETVKVNGTALTPDANKAVDVTFEIPERVTAAELSTFVV
jgi:hypothetical protein